MKKVYKGSISPLPSAVLYIEDVEAIYKVIREVVGEDEQGPAAAVHPSKKVEMRAGDYELDSPSELLEMGLKENERFTRELDITSRQPLISVNFLPKNASIEIGDDSLLLQGVKAKVIEIVKKRQRFFQPFVVFRFGMPISFSLLAPSVYVLYSTNWRNEIPIFVNIEYIASGLLALFVGIMMWSLDNMYREYSKIMLSSRTTVGPNFFVANKDKFINGGFAAAGVVMKWLFDQATK